MQATRAWSKLCANATGSEYTTRVPKRRWNPDWLREQTKSWDWSSRRTSTHSWLRENIYQHGAKYTASELVERISGGPLTIEPYIRYLNAKFGDLYELN